MMNRKSELHFLMKCVFVGLVNSSLARSRNTDHLYGIVESTMFTTLDLILGKTVLS